MFGGCRVRDTTGEPISLRLTYVKPSDSHFPPATGTYPRCSRVRGCSSVGRRMTRTVGAEHPTRQGDLHTCQFTCQRHQCRPPPQRGRTLLQPTQAEQSPRHPLRQTRPPLQSHGHHRLPAAMAALTLRTRPSAHVPPHPPVEVTPARLSNRTCSLRPWTFDEPNEPSAPGRGASLLAAFSLLSL